MTTARKHLKVRRAAARGPRVGLALGSGSARGWAHIGVIEALEDAGIHPEVVCGTSIGALVGAAYVTGHLPALGQWARKINWREMARFIDFRVANGGLTEGERIMRSLRGLQHDVAIESLDTPFAAVAADLANGHEVWLREGSLIEAVRASMALPGLLSPVTRDERRLVDGGLVNPVPVAPCRALGAELIIAVNLNGELVGRRLQKRQRKGRTGRRSLRVEIRERLNKELPSLLRGGTGLVASQLLGTEGESPGYFDVIFGSINIMQDRITRNRLADDPPDVLLVPKVRQINLLEFNRAREAIEEGHKAVRQMLPELEEALGTDREAAPSR